MCSTEDKHLFRLKHLVPLNVQLVLRIYVQSTLSLVNPSVSSMKFTKLKFFTKVNLASRGMKQLQTLDINRQWLNQFTSNEHLSLLLLVSHN